MNYYFRKVETKDKKAIFKIMKNKEVSEFLPWNYFKRLSQVDIKKLQAQKCQVLIYKKKIIGYFLLREYYNYYDISYFLLPKFWGVGFGKIMIKKIIETIEKIDENWKGIEGIIHPLNFRSMKLLINSNFNFVGIFEGWYIYRLKRNEKNEASL